MLTVKQKLSKVFFLSQGYLDTDHVQRLPSDRVCRSIVESNRFKGLWELPETRAKIWLKSDVASRHRLLAVRSSVRKLTLEQQYEDAYLLLQLPQTEIDTAHLLTMLRVSEKLGDPEKLNTTVLNVKRLTEKNNLWDPRLSILLERLRARDGLYDHIANFCEQWGAPPPPTLREGLADLMRFADKAVIDNDLLDWVYDQRLDRDIPYGVFKQNVICGNLRSRYSASYFKAQINDKTAIEPYMRLGFTTTLNEDPFKTHIDAGRSVVIAFSHTGMMGLLNTALRRIDGPVVQIGANMARTKGIENGTFLSTRGNFQSSFLKLIKRARKSPKIITLAADGPYGGDLLEYDFLGRKIKLAQGSATLAYHTGAATFFCGTRWVGDTVELYTQVGPIAERGMNRDDWNSKWDTFLLNCLKDVVQGPAIDMRFYSGIWRVLALAKDK